MTHTRSVLVTGGSSGIGLATAERFLSDGYQVAICARRADRLAAAAKALNSERVFCLTADLADPSQASTVVREAAQAMRGLGVVVNAHGIIGTPAKLEDLTAKEWQSVLNTNLIGPIMVTSSAIPYLRESRGNVVNVSSINAIQAEPWVSPYGVSKSGLVGFTRYAAVELAPYDIRINAVLPGWVRTPMAQPFFEEAGVVGKTLETNLMGRAAEPNEIASVIAFLASEQASFMTGECLVADGGQWVKMSALAARPDEPDEPSPFHGPRGVLLACGNLSGSAYDLRFYGLGGSGDAPAGVAVVTTIVPTYRVLSLLHGRPAQTR